MFFLEGSNESDGSDWANGSDRSDGSHESHGSDGGFGSHGADGSRRSYGSDRSDRSQRLILVKMAHVNLLELIYIKIELKSYLGTFV